MSDETKSDIDPRFDPAFQRGFDPATPIRERVPAPSGRPVEPVTQQAPPSPAFVAPVVIAPTAPSATAAQNAQAAPVLQDVEAELPPATLDAEEQPAPPGSESAPGRNPYLLLLGIVAVILVAVGVWLFQTAGAGFNSREVRSQGDYMALGATIQFAPFISLLGVATAIGVVFVFAAKWRRRG